MNQGDVYWYKFKEPNKERPILILTRTDLIPILNSVTIAEVTTTIRDNKAEVWLDEADGLLESCVANLVNIQTVLKARLGRFITHVPEERLKDDVRKAMEFVFHLWE